MGVLFYRGHSFAAMEWADRYHPQLLAEAETLEGAPAEAFHTACQRAHDAFTTTGRYGLMLTLRDALEKGTFDCVRATDLALALFRNSGRAGVGHVRWSAGTMVPAPVPYLVDFATEGARTVFEGPYPGY